MHCFKPSQEAKANAAVLAAEEGPGKGRTFKDANGRPWKDANGKAIKGVLDSDMEEAIAKVAAERALGLHWRKTGRPCYGEEVTNPALAAALLHKQNFGRRYSHVHSDVPNAILTFTKEEFAAFGALGLKWRKIGTSRPDDGQELTNEALATALTKKQQLTHQELRSFDVQDLRPDHYILVPNLSGNLSGGEYFEPIVGLDGLRPDHYILSGGPGDEGRAYFEPVAVDIAPSTWYRSLGEHYRWDGTRNALVDYPYAEHSNPPTPWEPILTPLPYDDTWQVRGVSLRRTDT